jgi:hypothetical protein
MVELHRKDANETNVRLELVGHDDRREVEEPFASGLL